MVGIIKSLKITITTIVEKVKIIYIGHDHGHDHHLHHDHHPHLLSIELYEGQHPLLGAELALVIHVLQHIDCHDDHFCSHDDCDFDEDADCYHDFHPDILINLRPPH